MDRSRARPVPCPSAVRPARAPLPRADARSVSADARLDRAGGSANKADNRFPERRLMLQKNRRFRVPVFLPSMWAGRKFRSCGRRCKKFLRSSRRDSRVRDTSFPAAEVVRVFSCALDSKSITTACHAARIHKYSLQILQQLFNNRFWFASVSNLGIDHVVARIVGTKRTTVAKLVRIFARGAVALARIGMNEDRSTLGICMAGWNCRMRK